MVAGIKISACVGAGFQLKALWEVALCNDRASRVAFLAYAALGPYEAAEGNLSPVLQLIDRDKAAGPVVSQCDALVADSDCNEAVLGVPLVRASDSRWIAGRAVLIQRVVRGGGGRTGNRFCQTIAGEIVGVTKGIREASR